jgi:hypothetical protein|nr:MAG TPA: hypothetical protein [Caudoviricetes sp.]
MIISVEIGFSALPRHARKRDRHNRDTGYANIFCCTVRYGRETETVNNACVVYHHREAKGRGLVAVNNRRLRCRNNPLRFVE